MLTFNLRESEFSGEGNDYTAVVVHQERLSIDDIAAMVQGVGTNADAIALAASYRRVEQKIIELATQGYLIDTGLYHIMTTISGVFKGVTAEFSKDAGHRKNFAINATAAARERLDAEPCRNIGVLQAGPIISTIEDVYTHTRVGTAAADGETISNTITPNRNLILKGKNLRILSDGIGTHDQECGVWFVNADVPGDHVRVPDADVVENMPSKVIIVTPQLDRGNWWLELTTQSSSGGGGKTSKTINTPRRVRFHLPLIVT